MNSSEKNPNAKGVNLGEPDIRAKAYEDKYIDLQRKLYKLEAENASLKARIKVLEEEKPESVIRTMTDAELDAAIEPLIQKLGYVKK